MALKTQSRGPFTGGYVSSVPAFMAREDQLWGQQDGSDPNSSRDCFIDPFSGGVSKRLGCAIVGDTVSPSTASGSEVAGLLSAKWGAKARRFFALDSPSLTDGYPTRAVLYGEDTNAGFPATDSGFQGTIYFRSTNGGAALPNRQLLKEFSTSYYAGTYDGAHDADDFRLRVVPIWIESGDGVYNRGQFTGTAGTDPFMHQFTSCGSRSVVQTQNWLYSPNLRCTPWRWNKRFNDGTGSEVTRIFPTGPFGPLYPPTATTPAADTSGTSWSDGDTFYISVIFRFEDGSCSLPFIPRAPGPTLTSGLGLVTVGTIGGGSRYRYMTYSNIPLGPEGTIERIICRTNKQNRTSANDNITIAALDLRVVGVLKNNVQTSYIDFGGDDDSLKEDEDVVRFDLLCPRRARYIGTGDQRVLVSYTLPNTGAIMLAPTGSIVSRDKNLLDTNNALYGTAAYLVRITSTQLELHFNTAVAPDFTAVTGNAKAFTFATYDTLDKLVDAINATTVASECKQWAAQLAPGIDGTMPSASLTLTTMDIAVTGTSSVTLTGAASDIAKIGVGMQVKGTNITTGTYVVAKPSATTLTISTATTGAPGATSTFYQNTGDNGVVTGVTVGYLRSFACTFPLLLHMKPSAFPKYDQPDTSSVYYTLASPGALSSGVSLAPNSWPSGNKLTTSSSPRQQMRRVCTGIADMEGEAVVAYTDGIKVFTNKRGGNTGEDFDYRLFTINDARGCISYLSLVSGNGWVAYATTEGLVATDKSGREFSFSGDVFNPSDNKGDLAYEILTSAASAASDSDNQYLSLSVMGSRIAVGFRISGDDPRLLFYDFSPGVEASGIEELLDPERKRPYIWSPPAVFNNAANLLAIGAMGSIRNASGRLDYICYDSNIGTGDGRIDQINVSGIATDQGSTVTAVVIPAPFMAVEFNTISPQNFEATHLTTSGAATIYLANNQVPTFNTTSDYARVLNVDSLRTQFQKQTIPIAQGQRGRTDMLWMQWNCTTGSSNRLWRMVLQYDEAAMDVGQPDLV